jgi:2-aminoadipate transaminase
MTEIAPARRRLELAGWARAAGTSALQTMLSASSRPGMISFAMGMPAPELFPTEEYGRAAAEELAENPRALQYSPPHAPMQEQVVKLMAQRGVQCTPEQVFLTSGAQQGISLLARLLLEPGGEIITERVCYTGFQQAVEPFGPRYLTVPSDPATGIDVDAVEAILLSGARPAFLYTVADGNNPLANSLSREKRARLAGLAAQHGVPIIEDDPYGFISYDGPPATPIRGFGAEWVFYVGSFSKILAPGLRLGWMVVPEEMVPLLAIAKESSDINTATLAQRAAARYLGSGHFPGHLDRLRAEYRLRRDTLLAALAEHFPAGARWQKPEAGLFVWVEMPERVDASEVLRAAIEQGVLFIPGDAFAADGTRAGSNCLRLNFSHPKPPVIEEGIERLGGVLKSLGA